MTLIAITIIIEVFILLTRKGYPWPLTMPALVTLAFSVIGVNIYLQADSIEYYFLLFSPGIFVFISSIFISKVSVATHSANRENINISRTAFFILIIVTFISAILAMQSGGGDNRILAYKNNRILSLLLFSSHLILIYYMRTVFRLCKFHKIDKLLLFLYIIGLVLSGSKGAAVAAFFIVFGVYLISEKNTRKSQKNASKSLWFISTSILILFFSVAWNYGFTDVVLVFNVVFTRIMHTGDLYYYWSMQDGDFTGYSNYLSYLLHPFTSLLGVRGYELPFGAELFYRVTGDDSGFGPNPHLSLLSLVLAGKNIYYAVFLMITSLLFFYILKQTSIIIIRRLYLNFYQAYSLHINICFLMLFIDIGMFEFIFIGSVIWFIVIYLIRSIFSMKIITRKVLLVNENL